MLTPALADDKGVTSCGLCSYVPTNKRDFVTHLLSEHGLTPHQYLDRCPEGPVWCKGHSTLLPANRFYRHPGDKTWGLHPQCTQCLGGRSESAREAGGTTSCGLCAYLPASKREFVLHLMSGHGLTPRQYLARSPTGPVWCNGHSCLLPVAHFFPNLGDKVWGIRSQCIPCFRRTPSADLLDPTKSVACPQCHRLFMWKGNPIFQHMWDIHGISRRLAMRDVIAKRYCPQCDTVNPISAFSEQVNEENPYFSWCRQCNYDRSVKRAEADARFGIFQHLIVRLAFNDRCFVCGITQEEHRARFDDSPLQVDHVVPHISGSELWLDNAALLCMNCNGSKKAKPLEDWLSLVLPAEDLRQAKLRDLSVGRPRFSWTLKRRR